MAFLGGNCWLPSPDVKDKSWSCIFKKNSKLASFLFVCVCVYILISLDCCSFSNLRLPDKTFFGEIFFDMKLCGKMKELRNRSIIPEHMVLTKALSIVYCCFADCKTDVNSQQYQKHNRNTDTEKLLGFGLKQSHGELCWLAHGSTSPLQQALTPAQPWVTAGALQTSCSKAGWYLSAVMLPSYNVDL